MSCDQILMQSAGNVCERLRLVLLLIGLKLARGFQSIRTAYLKQNRLLLDSEIKIALSAYLRA